LSNWANPVPSPFSGNTIVELAGILENALSIALTLSSYSLSDIKASSFIVGFFLVGIPIALGSPLISLAWPQYPCSNKLSPNR